MRRVHPSGAVGAVLEHDAHEEGAGAVWKKAETEIQYCELDLYSFAFLRSPQTGELAAACKFGKSFTFD